MKCTSLDIQDTASIVMVHSLQHSTSCSTTYSKPNAVVNTLKQNHTLLLAANYGKLMKSHDDVMTQMKPRVAANQKGSEYYEYCTASIPNRSFWWRKDKKHTFEVMQGKRNSSRIMWIEFPLWHTSELKMQRQRLSRSWKI